MSLLLLIQFSVWMRRRRRKAPSLSHSLFAVSNAIFYCTFFFSRFLSREILSDAWKSRKKGRPEEPCKKKNDQSLGATSSRSFSSFSLGHFRFGERNFAVSFSFFSSHHLKSPEMNFCEGEWASEDEEEDEKQKAGG